MIVLIQIWYQIKFSRHTNEEDRALPWQPVVKTSSSNAEGVGSVPGHLRAHMPHGQKTRTRTYTVTNSITTLKMVHIKIYFEKKKDK